MYSEHSSYENLQWDLGFLVVDGKVVLCEGSVRIIYLLVQLYIFRLLNCWKAMTSVDFRYVKK